MPTGARRDLLDRVPVGATVLDVGCWAGFAGRYLAAERGATVDGVEPVGEMAALAAGRGYREVLESTAEAAVAELAERPARYDAVLFLDVLEHLADPGSVLRATHGVLAPGGAILASIPNVAHWSVRKELAMGRFRYEPHGIMDATHLRFFTLATAEELLTGAGFGVTWRGASLGQPPLLRVGEKGLRMLARWPRLFAVQGLFEARPVG